VIDPIARGVAAAEAVLADDARPTNAEMETAMAVLLWLHSHVVGSGADRDDISHVRHLLDQIDEID
jgi:hypothetical protein